MTIQLLHAFNGYSPGIYSNMGAPEEARLISLGLARAYVKGMDGKSSSAALTRDAADAAQAKFEADGGFGGSTTLGPVADLTALNSTYPAGTPGRVAAVGVAAPYSIYEDNGSAWVLHQFGGGSGTPAYTGSTNLSVTTSSAGSTGVAFSSAACSVIEIDNDTGVDLEYQRGGAGNWMPLPNASQRLIVGITNASQISLRRTDQATAQVTLVATAMSGGATYSTAVILTASPTGATPAAFPSQACTKLDIVNNTNAILVYRIGAGATRRIQPFVSHLIEGITNANQVDVRRADSNGNVTVYAEALA